MLSHRIIVPKPVTVYQPQTYTYQPLKHLTQKELDDVLERAPFVKGQYVTYLSGGYLQPNSNYANVMKIMGYQNDATKLEYSHLKPKIYDVVTFYRSGMSAPYRRWDEGTSFRALTAEELDFVTNDAKLQNQIQAYL